MKLDPLPDQPLMSVVVASYNQGEFIGETIDSVLNQNYEPMELVIVDGGSTDNTLNVLHNYDSDSRVIWVSESDNGPNDAFQKGLQMATGDLVGFQSSSDTYEPGFFSAVAAEYRTDELLAMVGGSVKEINVSGRLLGVSCQTDPSRHYTTTDEIALLEGDPPLQASFFRRDIALSIDGIDEDAEIHVYFFFRYMFEATRYNGRFLMMPEHWGNFRRHSDSNSGRQKIDPLPRAIERRIACERIADQYSDLLQPDQIRGLLNIGYRCELGIRIGVKKQIIAIIPIIVQWIRHGGLSTLVDRELILKGLRHMRIAAWSKLGRV